jgi:hypothetical protein
MSAESGVTIALVIALGFLPMIWAGIKVHHNFDAIAVLNLLSFAPLAVAVFMVAGGVFATILGMMPLIVAFVMWSGALVWAATIVRHDLKAQREAHQQGQPAARRRPIQERN